MPCLGRICWSKTDLLLRSANPEMNLENHVKVRRVAGGSRGGGSQVCAPMERNGETLATRPNLKWPNTRFGSDLKWLDLPLENATRG